MKEKMSSREVCKHSFVALDELGVDTSGYTINSLALADTFYEMYSDSCQREHKNNYEFSEDYEIGRDIAQLTSSGIIGTFRWFALTTYYGPDVYKMNKDRELQNSIHRETMQRGSYELGKFLNHALNSSKDIQSLIREPIVLNTKDLMDISEYGFLSAMQNHLENFMELPHVDIAKVEDNMVIYDWSLLSEKDVIIPFIIGSQSNLNKFARIASEICGKDKATCAVGVFITRIKPSLDGRDPQIIDNKEQIPVISESPFITPIV